MAKLLTKDATAAMNAYVDFIYAECLGEGETYTLGAAWREAETAFERAAIATAIIYRTDALSDRLYRIVEDRGEMADARLCVAADALELARY